MKRVLLCNLLLAWAVLAQNPEPQMRCDDRENNGGRARACEMKEWTIPASGHLSVDGGNNGGVQVKGWSRADVLVRAKIQTWAATEAEAKSLIGQVNVQTAGGNVQANAPEFGRDRGYAVSYEVFVPQRTDLNLKAHNGGIAIDDVRGRLEFSTTNGGVNLRRLAGAVHGQTTNGGLNVELSGARWDGEQFDARTTNGGVHLKIPANYSARLEASTVNGGFRSEIDMTVRGEVSRNINATLGSGGPLIKIATTNGGIQIRKI